MLAAAAAEAPDEPAAEAGGVEEEEDVVEEEGDGKGSGTAAPTARVGGGRQVELAMSWESETVVAVGSGEARPSGGEEEEVDEEADEGERRCPSVEEEEEEETGAADNTGDEAGEPPCPVPEGAAPAATAVAVVMAATPSAESGSSAPGRWPCCWCSARRSASAITRSASERRCSAE